MLAVELAPDVQTWAVGALVSAALTVFAFLARKAFGDLGEKLSEVSRGVDALRAVLAKHDTDNATLSLRVTTLEAEVRANRERYHELVNTLTARVGLVDTHYQVLLERVRSLESAMRQVREGDEVLR